MAANVTVLITKEYIDLIIVTEREVIIINLSEVKDQVLKERKGIN